jgi:hypothetical protein
MNAHVLIDYDNLLPGLKGLTLAPLARKVEARLDGLVAGIDDIFLRLYGGWYDDKGLSKNGTIISQEIQRNFPIPVSSQGKIKRRIHCELASSLVDFKSDVLLFTVRRRRGMRTKHAAALPSGCINTGACTLPAVFQWTRGRCPETNCPVLAEDAFSYTEQKLVDTLLCCDLLALAERNPPLALFVISDDDDMIPAFLHASSKGAAIHQLRMRPQTVAVYEPLLRHWNVTTVLL